MCSVLLFSCLEARTSNSRSTFCRTHQVCALYTRLSWLPGLKDSIFMMTSRVMEIIILTHHSRPRYQAYGVALKQLMRLFNTNDFEDLGNKS